MQQLNSLVQPRQADEGDVWTARLASIVRYPFMILALLWFAGMVIINVFDKDLWELNSVFAGFVPWSMVGCSIILALTIAGLRIRSSLHGRDAPLALGILMAGLITHFGAGPYLSMNVRFLIARHHYEQRLEKVLTYSADFRAPDVAAIEPGVPKRVAFYWKRGVVDNWVGLVHDPTGEVIRAVNLLANPSATFDPVQDRVRDLFGGALYVSRHLTGNWYICWFT